MAKHNMIAENDNSTVVAKYTPTKKNELGYQTEAQLEEVLIELLKNQGYEYLLIKTEKDLINNLKIQIEKLNKYKFSDTEWKNFYAEVLAKSSDGIVGKTKKIQEERKFELTKDNGEKKNILILDIKNIHNNSVQVINQYKSDGGKNRYDVDVLINGLPLVHIELKRRGVDLKKAFEQIDRYKRDSFWVSSALFEWVQIFVISNGTYTKYFSNTTREEALKATNKSNTFEFTTFWADAENNNICDIVDFTKTFFAKHTILNILTKYCVLTTNNRLLVMRPYQIIACERIMNRIICGHQNKKYGKNDAGGYIWHTTGSGKTLTSFKTAQLISKFRFDDKDENELAKVLFVVDRKDLDYQTMKEYDEFKKGSANSNTSTKILTQQLKSTDVDKKIIITTIQKLSNFTKKHKNHFIYDKEVVIVFDECHRSQFGDMHKEIKKKFKKYYMFGFTGTPIFVENAVDKYQTTEKLFGDKLHSYTIVDAINDKNVLKFKVSYHNTIKSKANIKDKKVSSINYNKVFMDPKRIENNVRYVIEHYHQYTKTKENYIFATPSNVKRDGVNQRTKEIKVSENVDGFNSIFACSSIKMAKAYYSEFNKYEHNLKVAIIYSSGTNEELDGLKEENNEKTEKLNKSDREFLQIAIEDYNKIFKCNYNAENEFQNYYKDISLRTKNKEIDILIVVNMFLTGFDATTLNTLWIDKNLKYHGLLQAFSRTNRILNSVKTFGNIVCFRNLENEMNEALLLFGNRDSDSIVLLEPYKHYIEGEDGYEKLVQKLKGRYPLDKNIEPPTDENKKNFIKLYGQILKVRNILTTFDEFKDNNLLEEREMQDYQSRYLDLHDEFNKKTTEIEGETINDDLLFETELLKQVEINIDYIIQLIEKFVEKKSTDKKVLIKDIEKTISSSTELRSKKDLIVDFINKLNIENTTKTFDRDFEEFMDSKRKLELDELIKSENLKKEETYKFIEKSFRIGRVESGGDEITKLFNDEERLSRFNENTAEQSYKQKHTLINRIRNFVERFVNISSKNFH